MARGHPDGIVPHVLVADVADPALAEQTWHHLVRARRLGPGSAVTVTDGRGRWRPARLGRNDVDVDGDIVEVPRPDPEITVAFALTKGDKPELVVQKLTELGVDRIVAFRAERSVVRWDVTKAEAARARWTAVAHAAVEQSRRCWTPVIEPIIDFATVAARGVVRVDRGGGAAPSLAQPMVAVGPEGGWSDDERGQLPDAMGLGPTVLRAETAALTAAGILCALRSGVVAETPGLERPRR